MQEPCWMRCLDFMVYLKQNPNVEKVCMVLGFYSKTGHAWIRYRTKDGRIVNYDPSYNQIISITKED